MNLSQMFILISIVALALVIILFVMMGKRSARPLSPLAGLALALIVAGIFFGQESYFGYGLTGSGVVLALVDILIKFKSGKKAG